MKLFLLKNYYIALRRVWPITLPLFFLGLVLRFFLVAYQEIAPWGGIISTAYFFVWFIFTLYLSHNKFHFSLPILLKYGVVAPAKLVNTRAKSGEGGGVFSQHTIVFRRPDGSVDETHFFETRVHGKVQILKNARTYPQEMFMDYPRVGEDFEIIYLEGYEKYWMILNTGNTAFAQRVQAAYQQKQLDELESKLRQAEIRLAMEPMNPEKQRILDEAQLALRNHKEFATKPSGGDEQKG